MQVFRVSQFWIMNYNDVLQVLEQVNKNGISQIATKVRLIWINVHPRKTLYLCTLGIFMSVIDDVKLYYVLSQIYFLLNICYPE